MTIYKVNYFWVVRKPIKLSKEKWMEYLDFNLYTLAERSDKYIHLKEAIFKKKDLKLPQAGIVWKKKMCILT